MIRNGRIRRVPAIFGNKTLPESAVPQDARFHGFPEAKIPAKSVSDSGRCWWESGRPLGCQQFLNHIDTYFLIDETSSSCSELTIRALSIENQFSEYIQTINQEITEVSELQIFIHQSSTDVTFYENLLDTKLQDLDNNEYINYHNTLLLMLFDRWQRSRQMSDTARNLFNLSSLTDINNDRFINEIYTLISNTAYHASIIKKK
ncbi:unnamed protein product [Rotaria magnacalcarata]